MPLLTGLKVVLSKIHGYGLVTTRPFRRGEIVIYGDGVLYREAEDFDDTYALILPGYEIDENGDEGPPLFYDLADQTRWINHCCEPNCEVDTSWDPATRTARAWWVALRHIEVGEEITYDYAFSADVAEPCACGADRCRGLIVDADDVTMVPEPLRVHLRRQLLKKSA